MAGGGIIVASALKSGGGAGMPSLDAAGSLLVNAEGKKPTYRVVDLARNLYTGATAVWQLVGAAGKVIKLSRLKIVGRATAVTQIDIQLIKRSSINTGGTIAALSNIVPMYSGDPVPSGVPQIITAAPTLGTLVGAFDIGEIILTAAGTAELPNAGLSFDFGANNDKMPTLVNAAELIEVNFGTWTTTAGNTFDFMMEWTENGPA